jgi:hypothetical protein
MSENDNDIIAQRHDLNKHEKRDQDEALALSTLFWGTMFYFLDFFLN